MSDEYVPSLTLDPNAGDAAAAAIPAVEEAPKAETEKIPVERKTLYTNFSLCGFTR